MILSLVVAMLSPSAPDSKVLEVFGIETMMQIRSTYYNSKTKYYSDALENGKAGTQPAFDWGVGVLLSGLNSGAKAYPPFKPWLKEFADATHSYWNKAGPVAGYDVLPGMHKPDRYYDDNAWMVMALADTSEVLKDPKYLQWAKDSLTYVLSGEDEKLGGGIYWREQKKTSKNTCSNGPAAAACLSVYKQTKDKQLLEKAIQLYAWTKKNLQDPSDYLFYDSIGLTGKIGKDKWSYNTALMIRTAVELHTITREETYLADAKQMVAASIKHWYSPASKVMKDEGRFAHLLLDSWMMYVEQTGDQKLVPTPMLEGILVTLHDKMRNDQGLYGSKWSSQPKSSVKRFELIDQASALRGFFRASEFLSRTKQ